MIDNVDTFEILLVEDEDVVKAYDYNANCYIRKPVHLNRFLEIVSAIESFWLTFVKLPPSGR